MKRDYEVEFVSRLSKETEMELENLMNVAVNSNKTRMVYVYTDKDFINNILEDMQMKRDFVDYYMNDYRVPVEVKKTRIEVLIDFLTLYMRDEDEYYNNYDYVIYNEKYVIEIELED